MFTVEVFAFLILFAGQLRVVHMDCLHALDSPCAVIRILPQAFNTVADPCQDSGIPFKYFLNAPADSFPVVGVVLIGGFHRVSDFFNHFRPFFIQLVFHFTADLLRRFTHIGTFAEPA